MKTTWSIVLEEDPLTGELIMPFPPDLLAQVGWDFGDTIVFKEEGGTWSMTKKETDDIAHSKFYYDTERNK